MPKLIIGTRASPLALRQAGLIQEALAASNPALKIQILKIKTTGDRLKVGAGLKPAPTLAAIGGKALFVKEIEEALVAGKIDLAVHSMKDLPTDLPKGLEIAAITRREDPRDVFVARRYDSLLDLPRGATIGTGSLRRQSQVKNFRPDLKIVPLRGNVETRLRKAAQGECDAVILAAAGLIRLGFESRIRQFLPPSLMLPAVGQGALGIEIRANDDRIRLLARSVNDPVTESCVRAERAFLKTVGGNCQAPIAAYGERDGQRIVLTGLIATPDGRELIRNQLDGSAREPERLGEELGRLILGQGGRQILKSCLG